MAGVALATANCSTAPQKLAGPAAGNGVDPKYGVKASPRLYNEGDAIPKGGGRRFSGKPYVVAGHTYVPREDARGYVREGLASWYGAAFHGRMTANGEVFDRLSIAAAHPTLPLPSYARVTNLANGHSMVVRVNDRGPYHAGRVMDVSEEVARALSFHNKGTERVRVEYVGKASVAGSDDRKLLATLRTDGRPAGRDAPVMLADLGPSEEPELSRGLEKPARAPLAFRPEREEEAAPPPAPRARPAPVMIAAATVPVPAAVQPGAARVGAFRPEAGPRPVAARSGPLHAAPQTASAAVAGLNPAADARRGPARPARMAAAETPVRGPAARGSGGKAPAAMPPSARLAMARLASGAAPAGKGEGKKDGKGNRRAAQLAGIY